MPVVEVLVRFVSWPATVRTHPLVLVSKFGPAGPWVALVDHHLIPYEDLTRQLVQHEINRLKRTGFFPWENHRETAVEYFAAAAQGQDQLKGLLATRLADAPSRQSSSE